jgi:hypothetical protein
MITPLASRLYSGGSCSDVRGKQKWASDALGEPESNWPEIKCIAICGREESIRGVSCFPTPLDHYQPF